MITDLINFRLATIFKSDQFLCYVDITSDVPRATTQSTYLPPSLRTHYLRKLLIKQNYTFLNIGTIFNTFNMLYVLYLCLYVWYVGDPSARVPCRHVRTF